MLKSKKEIANLNRMREELQANGAVAQQIINDLEPVLAKLHLTIGEFAMSRPDKEKASNRGTLNLTLPSDGKFRFISQIQKIDGFAAKIAETVDKTMNPYGKKVAFISEKQSWILAVAAVENNITL